MKIRLYKDMDRRAVLSLMELLVPEYFAESEIKDFEYYLDRYSGSYYVAVTGNDISGAGGLNYFPEEQLARISWDMIHPDHQGTGIGKTLVQYRIDQIKAQMGYSHVIVRTSQLAHLFYQKMGFKLERVEKDFWAIGFDLYQMRMDIQPR